MAVTQSLTDQGHYTDPPSSDTFFLLANRSIDPNLRQIAASYIVHYDYKEVSYIVHYDYKEVSYIVHYDYKKGGYIVHYD